MTINPKARANWLQCKGTFCAMCSRNVTKYLTINQKGGLTLL